MSSLQRDRLRAPAQFVWQRFLADRCPQTAGALAYTTLFALVPVTAAALACCRPFRPSRAGANASVILFDNFVPSAGKAVQAYLAQFAANASQATLLGVLVLLASALALLVGVEDAFNRIWRVAAAPRRVASAHVLGRAVGRTVLLVAALAVSSYLFALPLFDQTERGLGMHAAPSGTLPFLIEWLALGASYVLSSPTAACLRDAAGALFAALLFEAAKRGFALYLASVPSYERWSTAPSRWCRSFWCGSPVMAGGAAGRPAYGGGERVRIPPQRRQFGPSTPSPACWPGAATARGAAPRSGPAQWPCARRCGPRR